MFKSLNTGWLKLALLRVYHSGWTLVVLVGLSLLLCNFHGRNAFLVWWLSVSTVALIGFSAFLSELPYQLIKPEMHISRYAKLWSCLVWCVGMIILCLTPVFADPIGLIFFEPVGALTGVLFCFWISRKGLLAWIQ